MSRQSLPVLDRGKLAPASGLRRGGYILWQSGLEPAIILIATGSEVHIALEAGKLLVRKGVPTRIVSLPSWELFDGQPLEYRDSVLPPSTRARVSIEAGTPLGWEHHVGLDGTAVGIPRFGASAPGNIIYDKLGLTAQRVADAAAELIKVRV
jgi:transketolase